MLTYKFIDDKEKIIIYVTWNTEVYPKHRCSKEKQMWYYFYIIKNFIIVLTLVKSYNTITHTHIYIYI